MYALPSVLSYCPYKLDVAKGAKQTSMSVVFVKGKPYTPSFEGD